MSVCWWVGEGGMGGWEVGKQGEGVLVGMKFGNMDVGGGDGGLTLEFREAQPHPTTPYTHQGTRRTP